MVEIRVKGSVFLGVFQAIEIVGGWSAREAAVLALSGDFGDAVRTNTVLASGWYPVAWHRALLGGVIDRGGALGLREVIHCATRQNVGAVHRLLVRAFTPALLIKQASRVFSSLFEGEFLVDIPESHLARVQWLRQDLLARADALHGSAGRHERRAHQAPHAAGGRRRQRRLDDGRVFVARLRRRRSAIEERRSDALKKRARQGARRIVLCAQGP